MGFSIVATLGVIMLLPSAVKRIAEKIRKSLLRINEYQVS